MKRGSSWCVQLCVMGGCCVCVGVCKTCRGLSTENSNVVFVGIAIIRQSASVR
ncbi:hypothetical protein P153DRAFT_366166 [Dothidotthia symphoricarpi CBS 119687]|uniref:Secreted protein n=1 Tax=Dothidotthia symphoricarpi CBS 119687 TaxID=1392245 RepID=A0A6A6AJI6_9PLEO|nr:uncharacterized protein P153DRAFT_366166 [Dothidotthia symphoricarpi CBS 119687]KAF2130601.1 hypothetical protein P153DRAFT_366166 [Dothidotthia symphoricarpi CBS 119687]